eukprot:scaffold114710_cov31-Phaeocystis_antarctica.AAC.1
MRPTWLVGCSASEACPATCSAATARFTWLGLGRGSGSGLGCGSGLGLGLGLVLCRHGAVHLRHEPIEGLGVDRLG